MLHQEIFGWASKFWMGFNFSYFEFYPTSLTTTHVTYIWVFAYFDCLLMILWAFASLNFGPLQPCIRILGNHRTLKSVEYFERNIEKLGKKEFFYVSKFYDDNLYQRITIILSILHKWHFLKKWIGCNIVCITWTPVIKISVVSLNKIWRLSKHGEYNKFPCPFDQRLNLNDILMIFEFAKKLMELLINRN